MTYDGHCAQLIISASKYCVCSRERYFNWKLLIIRAKEILRRQINKERFCVTKSLYNFGIVKFYLKQLNCGAVSFRLPFKTLAAVRVTRKYRARVKRKRLFSYIYAEQKNIHARICVNFIFIIINEVIPDHKQFLF